MAGLVESNLLPLSPAKLGITEESLAHHISCYGGLSAILAQIESAGEQLAAVVLCPANYTKQGLEQILSACHRHGIYVIFDEVTSGYRFAKGGVTTAFQLHPDFLCLSKGLTNGLPLSVALGGTEEILIMEQLKISSAHAGSHLALAAALACEKLLDHAEVWPSWKPQTDKILEKLRICLACLPADKALTISGGAGCFSLNTPGTVFWEDPFRLFLMHYLAQHHIFSKGYILFSDAHTVEEIEFVGQCLMDCILQYARINS